MQANGQPRAPGSLALGSWNSSEFQCSSSQCTVQPSLSLTQQRPWLVLCLASIFVLSRNTNRDAGMWVHSTVRPYSTLKHQLIYPRAVVTTPLPGPCRTRLSECCFWLHRSAYLLPCLIRVSSKAPSQTTWNRTLLSWSAPRNLSQDSKNCSTKS